MRFAALLERLRRPLASPAPVAGTDAEYPSPPASALPGPGGHAEGVDVDAVRQELDAIQEMIGHDRVEIPCGALLSVLPESLRGPAWQPDGYPDLCLQVDSGELLEQLAKGKVVLSLGDVAAQLPSGWVSGPVDKPVELSLAAVVSALPEELLETRSVPGEFSMDLGGMRDLFKPAVSAEVLFGAGDPADAVAEGDGPGAAESPSGKCPQASPASAGKEWDGVEITLESAPRGVDVNTASARELLRLPGVGPARARGIIAYRRTHGPFASIFELGQVPGIGRSCFGKMTGLSLRHRRRRQEKLNELLGRPGNQGLSIGQIAEGMGALLGAEAVTLASRGGIVLAASGDWEGGAGRYAALGVQMVRRLGRYTRRLAGDDGQCMILPTCQPPLMLAAAGTVVFVAALKRTSLSGRALARVRALVEEVAWLLGPRAVVRNIG